MQPELSVIESCIKRSGVVNLIAIGWWNLNLSSVPPLVGGEPEQFCESSPEK